MSSLLAADKGCGLFFPQKLALFPSETKSFKDYEGFAWISLRKSLFFPQGSRIFQGFLLCLILEGLPNPSRIGESFKDFRILCPGPLFFPQKKNSPTFSLRKNPCFFSLRKKILLHFPSEKILAPHPCANFPPSETTLFSLRTSLDFPQKISPKGSSLDHHPCVILRNHHILTYIILGTLILTSSLAPSSLAPSSLRHP